MHQGCSTSSKPSTAQMSVSGGDIAPLVGHNAFLRWEAVQKCAFMDVDGVERF